MPKYSPLVSTVVLVRLPEIEAESRQEAAKKVLETFDGSFFDRVKVMEVEYLQWSEDIDSVLIDEVGDEENENSRWYDKDGMPIMKGGEKHADPVEPESGEQGPG